MKTLVIGAHGKIGQHLCEQAARMEFPIKAMIRTGQQQPFFQRLGIETVLGDLEGDLRHAFENVDQVVFTAGSGAQTGFDKTLMIDLHGALRAIDLARALGVGRFMMISTLHTDPLKGPAALRPYLAAKHAADAYLIASRVPYLILRPGRLTDAPASGRIATSREAAPEGQVSRENVAQAALWLLQHREIKDREYVLLDGDEIIDTALR